MAGRFDESLLESPLRPAGDGRRRWVLFGIVTALVAGGVVFLVMRSGGLVSPDTPTTTAGPSATGPPTSTAISSRTLVSYSPEPALLYYPSLLPVGWRVCRQLEDVSQGDRFCDPSGDESAWIQIAIKDAFLVRLDGARATGDAFGGRWVDPVDETEIAYLISEFSVLVVLTNDGDLAPDDLVAVATSIPLVGHRDLLYGNYEAPLDLSAISDGQLASLVGPIDPDPRVVSSPGSAQVFMATGQLSLFYGDGFTLPDFAPELALPRLVEADRPVVVGESQRRGRSYAVWDQRGFGWRLELQTDPDTIAQVALDVIDRIAGLG